MVALLLFVLIYMYTLLLLLLLCSSLVPNSNNSNPLKGEHEFFFALVHELAPKAQQPQKCWSYRSSPTFKEETGM
jgi:hypothetical protein